MKLTFLLLTVACLQLRAESYAQVTMHKHNISLGKVFEQIYDQTGYQFVCTKDMLKEAKKVTINVDNASLKEVLDISFKDQPLTYTIRDKAIIVKKKENGAINQVQAIPPLEVKGSVTDSLGNPLIGVTIKAKDGGTGTVTDAGGNYTITVPDDAVLVISYVGYQTREIPVNHRQHIDIVLEPATSELNQLVVVGYGVQKKKDLTGSISTISANKLEKRIVSTVADALQGADPSLNITFSNGSPNRGYGLNIRGVPSINGGNPLILMDGVEVNLNMINPHDIKSVTVLKDAAAQAIYGAKASAGVILITTKGGPSAGKPEISFTSTLGFSENTTTTDFIHTGYDQVQIINEFYKIYKGSNILDYEGEDLQLLKDRRNDLTENRDRPWVLLKDNKYYYYGNFDWYNYIFRKKRPQQEYNLSARGGDEKLNYYVSGRYWAQDGIFRISGDQFDNYSFYAKMSAKIKPWLKYTGSLSYNSSTYKYGGYFDQGSTFTNVQHQVISSFVPRNPDGSIVQYTNQITSGSPLGSGQIGFLTSGNGKHSKKTDYYILSNRLDADITKNITLTGTYAIKQHKRLFKYREMPFDYSRQKGVFEEYTAGSIYNFYQESTLNDDDHNLNVYGTFLKSFDGNHLKVTLGGQYEDYKEDYLRVKNKDLLSGDLSSFAVATGDPETEQQLSAFRTLGFFGRINYDYEEKYLLELSGRYDGTSRFAPSQRWGFFPSLAAAWQFSEEDFFKSLKNIMEAGKLRLSIGSLGNQQVGYYAYIDEIFPSKELSYTFDGSKKSHYSTYSNPISSSLTWETITTYNLGLDLFKIKNKLDFTGDLYIKDTKNMLAQSLTLPDVFGAPTPLGNVADMRTKGWDVTLKWEDDIKIEDAPLHYNIAVTLGDHSTTITKFNNPDKLISNYYVGQRLGDIWGYKVKGLFKTDEDAADYQSRTDDKAVNNRVYTSNREDYLQAGDVAFIDLNGDGSIDEGTGTVSDPGDKVIIGNSQPRYNYSIRLGADWKGIDISILFTGIGKEDWYPSQNAYGFWGPYSYPTVSFIPMGFMANTWSEDNPNAYFPKPRGYASYSAGALGVINDRYLQSVAYLRLRNLNIGYVLPINTNTGLKIRIFASGENLAYWSKLKKHTKLIDPEAASGSSSTGNVYKFSRSYNVGVNVTF